MTDGQTDGQSDSNSSAGFTSRAKKQTYVEDVILKHCAILLSYYVTPTLVDLAWKLNPKNLGYIYCKIAKYSPYLIFAHSWRTWVSTSFEFAQLQYRLYILWKLYSPLFWIHPLSLKQGKIKPILQYWNIYNIEQLLTRYSNFSQDFRQFLVDRHRNLSIIWQFFPPNTNNTYL